MIRCDRCGAYGSPQIRELGERYYRDFCSDGVPIYISQTENGGQLCGECVREIGNERTETYLDTVKRHS